jgi:hypothetical protein
MIKGTRRLIHGCVDLSKTPYPIRINKNQPKGRARKAMVHEMVHIIAKEAKIPMNERQVHQMALYIEEELLPMMEEFERQWEEVVGSEADIRYF